MRRDPDSDGRKILIGALALSVVLHALLLLISFVLPWAAPAAAVEPRPQEIRFSFTEPDPFPDAPDEERAGEVLADRRPQPQRQPRAVPLPPAPPASTDRQTTSLDTPPRPQPTADPSRPPRGDRRAEPEPEPATDPAETPTGTELPPTDRGRMAPGETSPPQRGVDLERALRSFQDAVDRAAADQPLPRSERNVFVPDPGEIPTQGAPYGVFEFSSRDYDWRDYARQLYERVMVAWYRRLDQSTSDFERWGRATSSLELVDRVIVRFTIEADGDVSGIHVLVPSECGPLDLSATDALEEVLLPALPEDFPRDREVVTGTFTARVADVFRFDDYFDYLKRYGIWPMNRAPSRERGAPIDGTDPRR